MMMRRVFFVVLAFALLCCCSCVFAMEEEVQEPQVLQVNAECADVGGKVTRWQLPGNSLWYNCTVEDNGVGKEICGMGGGNCTSEDVERRAKGVAKGGVFTINVTSLTPSAVKRWWESNVKSKAVTVESVPAKSLEAEPPSPPEHKDSRETSSRPGSESFPDGAEGVAGAPPPPPATPGGAVANSAAGAAATTDPSPPATLQAQNSAPAGELQGPSHSTSAASAAPESPPDPKPTEDSDHSSHDPSVELQEETAAAPPTQLSQTGEDGGAAEGAEEDTAANTTDTASTSEVNSTAASMPAPLSSAPKTNALENRVGTDACFHDTHLHALSPLVLAALTYGTLG
ncbi:90 kDa surface protein [Trypanosoma cruzi]|uniref:90 kDa surface protein, putative n=1 Tax=Trypanosoma cruzi (strain CL Brener) TaxID=353153 RepID=Q4E1F9_TRYCC|nr:90 kDa surface protein, putative [Trypanosoma cruzi]EAN98617.1 90 kDa surface protein, putative [Trypanosoma cruzi]RNC40116.1 90 kDa surface protein [Trypanosoma cruzi]|eukprot:XP_820468.1 90 kDa surface protein [Trypanosoma cruzi strain CL Brener]